jgi:coenzyme PQQ precursor peptide PqqA
LPDGAGEDILRHWILNLAEDANMKWEVPTAVELRLGMEINSYVSVR